MNHLTVLATMIVAGQASPTAGGAADSLEALVAEALLHNPALVAADARARAAEARIEPAGALPDPTLHLMVQNVPVSAPGFDDFMTMKSVGLAQELPYPGKRAAARGAATHGFHAHKWAREDLRLQVERDVRHAYYEIAFLDRSLEVLTRHVDVLAGLVRATGTRYAVGTAEQEDVLLARTEAAALADEAARIRERRGGAVAALNALLDRPAGSEIAAAALPGKVASLATKRASPVRFASALLGARVTDSPLRPVEELVTLAERGNPSLAGARALVDEQRARVDLAHKAHLPDLHVAVSYGERSGFRDMVTLSVALPLPLHRAARQDAWVTEAEAEREALEAEERAQVLALRAQVAQLHAYLERDRTSLALLETAVLPQVRAILAAATGGVGAARNDVRDVLATRAALFEYEIAYHRTLTDFAKDLADLQRVAGEEVVR